MSFWSDTLHFLVSSDGDITPSLPLQAGAVYLLDVSTGQDDAFSSARAYRLTIKPERGWADPEFTISVALAVAEDTANSALSGELNLNSAALIAYCGLGRRRVAFEIWDDTANRPVARDTLYCYAPVQRADDVPDTSQPTRSYTDEQIGALIDARVPAAATADADYTILQSYGAAGWRKRAPIDWLESVLDRIDTPGYTSQFLCLGRDIGSDELVFRTMYGFSVPSAETEGTIYAVEDSWWETTTRDAWLGDLLAQLRANGYGSEHQVLRTGAGGATLQWHTLLHSDLSSIGASDHHARYTDGEAAAAAPVQSVAGLDGAIADSALAAALAGTATGDLVQLENVSGSPGLPAVDGSQLTGLPATDPAGSDAQVQVNDGGAFGADADFAYALTTGVLTSGRGSGAEETLSAHLDQWDRILRRRLDGQSTYNEAGGLLLLDRQMSNLAGETGHFLGWSNDGGSTLLGVIDAQGRIGIGTDSPNGPMDMYFTNTDGSASGCVLKNEGASAQYSYAGFRFQAQSAVVDTSMAAVPESGTPMIGGGLLLRAITGHSVGLSTSNALRLRVDADGHFVMHASADTPESTAADTATLYIADFGGAAGNACVHIRNEAGAVIRLQQQAKADYNNWANLSDVVDALVAVGLFDAA